MITQTCWVHLLVMMVILEIGDVSDTIQDNDNGISSIQRCSLNIDHVIIIILGGT